MGMRGKRRVVQNNSAVSNAVFNICNNAFLVLFAFVCVYPFYYLIINSISSNTLSANGEILFWPREIHFSNYVQVFKLPGLIPTYFVLLLLSVASFLNNGFDQFFVFQNAFNVSKIQVLDLYVYNLGIGSGSYSLATAVSIMKSAVSLTLLFVCNGLSKLVRGETII